jgi:hypothetical protein
MFFQLNEAGGDPATIESPSFLVLGGSQNSSESAKAVSTRHGLSQAQKVGLGIGVPFAVVCLGALGGLGFVSWKRRKGVRTKDVGVKREQQRPELEGGVARSGGNLMEPRSTSSRQGIRTELPEK